METENLFCTDTVAEIFDSLDAGKYEQLLGELKDLFDTYREDRKRCPNDPEIRTAQRLIELDAETCKTADAVTKRQHNVFVHRYVGNLPLSHIAMTTNVTKRTVSRDIEETLKRIMVLAFGVDGVDWKH